MKFVPVPKLIIYVIMVLLTYLHAESQTDFLWNDSHIIFKK